MKIITFLISASALIVSILTKVSKKQKPMSHVSTQPAHISDMMTGTVNNNAPDRSPMWKNFRDNRFNRPFMHGVVGPQWSVPGQETTDGFNIISSPMPKPDLSTKIVAGDLPPRTYTPTSFDAPLRKDVVQADMPTMVTRTREESSDPRHPPKRSVARATGTLYHGTGSLDPRVIHGTIPSFIEKKNKAAKKNSKSAKSSKAKKSKISKRKSNNNEKSECRGKNFIFDKTRSMRVEGLGAAKQAYTRAGAMLGAIDGSPKFVLDVHTTNKREKPDIAQYENNAYLKSRVNGMRRSPHGVKAAHTMRKFGR